MIALCIPQERYFPSRVSTRMNDWYNQTFGGVATVFTVIDNSCRATTIEKSGAWKVNQYNVRYGNTEIYPDIVELGKKEAVNEAWIRAMCAGPVLKHKPTQISAVHEWYCSPVEKEDMLMGWQYLEQVMRIAFQTDVDVDQFHKEFLTTWDSSPKIKFSRGYSRQTLIISEVEGEDNQSFEGLLTLARRQSAVYKS